ncbi:neuromast-expressed gpi-anchored lymphocyte antigen 6, partial [Nerophis lumbriciformis]|uniref:neuromast-expressed gpi-anchored lymphocyte antigen 6 n=1 Tax=Nerophis lumbriciformis TaxID=546530 RepID=UPI003BACA063
YCTFVFPVDTLKCYECAAGSSGSCIDATKECPWLADHCGALRLIVYHDNAVIADIKGKSCTSAAHCANVSVNFGESRTLLTNKCCATDLCNMLPAPDRWPGGTFQLEVPQASTGFSPFELVYGRRPRGVLDIAKETWENQPSPHRSVIDHVAQLQARARKIWPMVREHMEKAQREQAKTYNRGATLREFQVGEKVLVLVPSSECKFLARWQGPYEVIERMGPVNYKVNQPGRRKGHQIYHVNILNKWHAAEPLPSTAFLTAHSPQTTPPVPIGEDLSPSQKQEVKELLGRNQDRLSELPGRTQAIKHDIETKPGKVIRQRPYRIPEARWAAIKEVKKMLELGVIEESHSPWSSPIVIVPKPDGSLRFCNDFRKLNEISLCDAYPMPRVDELIERLGPARFVSTLDLTKGYWQVPLTERAKPKTAFSTPEGLFQYTVLPFGIHGATATFQRMMDRVLRPHQEYAAAYLDDIVIHSTSWSLHLQHLDAVLGALRRAGLTEETA